MKNTEARKILGLDPKDNPRSYLPTFEETRKYKQELVDNAPSDEIRFRYEQELLEYEAALKVVVGKRKIRPHTDFLVVLMLIGALSACGWWGYNWYQHQWNLEAKNQQQITYLNAIGRTAISKRKWAEAEQAYLDIGKIDANSRLITEGVKSIKRGKLEELNQQLYYSLGESQAALEAGRWDEAERLALSVLETDPENTAAKNKLDRIKKGRHQQQVSLKVSTITDTLAAGNIAEAQKALTELKAIDPQNADLPRYTTQIANAAIAIRKQKAKAATLLESARKLDNGEFSPEAMALLTEARKLDPGNNEIAELHSKMSHYTRAINVPADHPTIQKALAAARPRDLIRIAPGTYKEALEIHKPIRLEGSADGNTILEISATEASLITINPEAQGTLINGFTIKHTGFNHGKERFAAITVMAEKVNIVACQIKQAGGHGIAIIDGASATITSSDVSGSGWDGISVYGKGAQVTIHDTKSQNNLQHGLGVWGGGSGTVTKSNMSKNGFCGILAMGTGAQITINETACSQNREAGILISHGMSARLHANRCDKNLLSGIVARSKKTKIDITNNFTTGNQEAGILTYTGVHIGKFSDNQANGNTSKQIQHNVKLEQ